MRTKQTACATEMQMLWIHSPAQMVPSLWKDVQHVGRSTTTKRYAEVAGTKKVHSIDPQKEQHQDEDEIDKVNIYSIYIDSITLNSKHSVITTNLNTSSRQAASVVSYKIDSGSNGNIMPFHIFKKVYPRSTKNHWQQQKMTTSN